jgi:hypothetical protein
MPTSLMHRVRKAPSLSRVVATLVCAVMLGSSPAYGQSTPPPVTFTCQSAQQCRIPVEVDCAHSPCTIRIASQFENVDTKAFSVVWEIVRKPGQSYTFKNPAGIFFKSAAGQHAYNCHREANGERFSCQGNKDGKQYKYGIELTGTPAVRKLDPWIVSR